MAHLENLTFLITPAAGNEPFLLGVAVARKVNEILQAKGAKAGKIVVPAASVGVKSVVLDEYEADSEDMFLDSQYGRVIAETLKTQGDFRSHMTQVLRDGPEIDRTIQGRFNKDASHFQARSLRDDRAMNLVTSNIVTLDIAPRFSVRDASSSHFIFPTLISELMTAVGEVGLDLDPADRDAFSKFMFDLEKRYTNVFISRIGTLSAHAINHMGKQTTIAERYRALQALPTEVNGRSRIYTPGMGRGTRNSSSILESESLYAMFSGTGSARAETRAQVESLLAEGAKVLVPDWIQDIAGAKPMSPSILFDPSVNAVVARSGFGTIWKAMRAGLPFLAVPYRDTDDPEMYFNDLTVERFGLGKVLPNTVVSREEVMKVIKECKTTVEEVEHLTQAEFATTDGVAYVAERVASSLLE